jgi:hypothetical protein
MALLGQPPPRPEPKDVLASVREQSCYGALRGLINFIFAVVLIFCTVTAIGGVLAIIKSFDNGWNIAFWWGWQYCHFDLLSWKLF